jgi:hypothetical protein
MKKIHDPCNEVDPVLNLTDLDVQEKEKELAAAIAYIKQHRETARIELHFKDGQLRAGNKFLPIL